MKRENDPTAGDVGRIFLSLLGIKTPKEISYKSGIGVVFEMKAKEDGSSVLLCLPKKDFYAGLLQEVKNKFYREFDCKRFTITMENIHWLSADDIFGRTIHDGNIWGTPVAGGNATIAIAATIGLTDTEARNRRYDDAKDMAISKAESLIEEMCAGSWHAWIDNAYASHDKTAQKCYEQAVEEWTLNSRNYKDCKHCPWNIGLGLSQGCGRECRVRQGDEE